MCLFLHLCYPQNDAGDLHLCCVFTHSMNYPFLIHYQCPDFGAAYSWTTFLLLVIVMHPGNTFLLKYSSAKQYNFKYKPTTKMRANIAKHKCVFKISHCRRPCLLQSSLWYTLLKSDTKLWISPACTYCNTHSTHSPTWQERNGIPFNVFRNPMVSSTLKPYQWVRSHLRGIRNP